MSPALWLSFANGICPSKGLLLLWWNTRTKSKLGRDKHLFGVHIYIRVPSLKEVRTGTQTGQEPGGSNWCRGREERLPTGLFLTACSSCFFFLFRTQDHQPRGGTSHIGQGPHTSITDKKMPYNTILWKYFLKWGFLLSDDASLCQVNRKLSNTTTVLYFTCKEKESLSY